MSKFPTTQGTLWIRSFGEPLPSVIALHGFTLHGGMFQALAEEHGISMLAPDLPGHGRTDVKPVSTASAVTAVGDLLRALPEPPLLLGYSQGSRVALQVAISHPDSISGLVLVSASPGLPEKERRIRRAADDGLASRIERIGVERFIDEWLTNPTTSTARVPSQRREMDRSMRLESTSTGLADALRGMGQASVVESAEQIAALPMPTVFVAGTRDKKYSQLAVQMAESRGDRAVLVPAVGHNVILEAPRAVADAVQKLLDH